MSREANNPTGQLCPECGDFHRALVERTGWCVKCTTDIERNEPICSVCGRTKEPHEPCLYCRLERWFLKNSDHVEHYQMQGHSLTKSITLVRAEVAPNCASCGGVMKHATRTAVFCRKTPRCRRAVRRYGYLTQDLGINKPQALSQVLQELNVND